MQAEGRAPLSGEPTPPADSPASTDSSPPQEHRPRHRRLGLLLVVAAVVVALDQLTKYAVVARLADHEPLRLLWGLVTLTYTRNGGAAFSLGGSFTLLFTAVAVAVVVVVLRVSRRLYSVGWAVALGALLGGAIGNLVDRLARSPGIGRGHVVDWVQLPHFAVFNLADAAITCSAVAMVLLSSTGHDVDGTRHRHRHG
jgi:signal peptidase II